MKTKINNFLLTALFVFGLTVSCQEAQIEDSHSTLPSVEKTTSINSGQLDQILNFQSITNGRVSQSLDYESTVIAEYHGYAGFQFAYVPSSLNEYEFELFVFHDGELSNHMTIENHENEMIITSQNGTVNLAIDGNVVQDASVTFSSVGNGRVTSGDCNIPGGFLDCTDQVINQAREYFGDYGGLAFDIACGLWVVCRGAFVVGCSALAISECLNNHD